MKSLFSKSRETLICLAGVLTLALLIAPVITAQGIQLGPTPTPIPPTPMPQAEGTSYTSRHGWSVTWGEEWIAEVNVVQNLDVLHLTHADTETYPDVAVQMSTKIEAPGYPEEFLTWGDAALGMDGQPLQSEPSERMTWKVAWWAGNDGTQWGTYTERRLVWDRVTATANNSSRHGDNIYVEIYARTPLELFTEISASVLEMSDAMMPDLDEPLPPFGTPEARRPDEQS